MKEYEFKYWLCKNSLKQIVINEEKMVLSIVNQKENHIYISCLALSQYFVGMNTKNINSAQLCTLPEVVQFEFTEEQEMNSKVAINSLVDSVVSFKIKTNKPGLYLVRPMEGQIFNKSSVSISIKRKELTLENFQAILNNPNQNKEKFLIEFSSEVVDAMDIPRQSQQVSYMGVQFVKSKGRSADVIDAESESPVKSSSLNHSKSPDRFEKKQSQPAPINLDIQLAEKKQQFQKLLVQKQVLQSKKEAPSVSQFSLTDLINVLAVFFLLGFII